MSPVLEIEKLTVTLQQSGSIVPVLENLYFSVEAGKTIALVGESGCGQSMTALAIMGLMPEGFAISGGRIALEGQDVAHMPAEALRHLRGNRMSMIFQEPMTALNPVYTVGDQIGEALRLHQGLSRQTARERAIAMLRAVQIPAPERRIDVYPHQMSGGMRQRVMIAMALACRPRLLIADEPTTALDVTVQAQIFDLLREMQQEIGTAIVLITHDLSAVADITDEVAVLYAGRGIEQGPTATILNQPQHPYTRGLIASVPHLRLGEDAAAPAEPLEEIPGMVPGLGKRGPLCGFAPRCRFSAGPCLETPPPIAGSPQHRVACWHPQGAAA